MKKLLIIALIMVLSGCNGLVSKNDIPLVDLFHSINDEPYILGINDCSNKSAKYWLALRAAGYDDAIIIGYMVIGEQMGHAVVYVGEKYIDVTNRCVNWNLPPNAIITVHISNERQLARYPSEFTVYKK